MGPYNRDSRGKLPDMNPHCDSIWSGHGDVRVNSYEWMILKRYTEQLTNKHTLLLSRL